MTLGEVVWGCEVTHTAIFLLGHLKDSDGVAVGKPGDEGSE